MRAGRPESGRIAQAEKNDTNEAKRNDRMNRIRNGRLSLLTAAVIAAIAVALVFGCAGKRKEAATSADEAAAAKTEKTEKKETEEPKRVQRKSLDHEPSYGLFEDSLRYYENKLGIEFYKNAEGKYMPFSVASWDSFSIADSEGQCLYDVEIVGLMKLRFKVLLEMDITQGPCNLKYPDTDIAVADRVSLMEGSVISKELIDRLNGISFLCSDKRFLQKVLQPPFDLGMAGSDLETSIAKIGEEVTDPMDLSFGDIVFFEPYPDEKTVGIYVGYGAVVYNTCFGAKIHKMSAKKRYRIYRIYTGFAWTRYRMHQQKFMQQYLGVGE